MLEVAVQQAIRLEAARRGIVLWRNNTGVLLDARGVPLRFGLANDSAKVNANFKSSDLIGICVDGKFLAIECKAPTWNYRGTARELAQLNFINLVISTGGRAGFARCIEDAIQIWSAP